MTRPPASSQGGGAGEEGAWMRAGARGRPPVAPLRQCHSASVHLHLWLGFSVNSPLLGWRPEDPKVHHGASKSCATAQAPEGAALLVLAGNLSPIPPSSTAVSHWLRWAPIFGISLSLTLRQRLQMEQFIWKMIPGDAGRGMGTQDRKGKTAKHVISNRLPPWVTEAYTCSESSGSQCGMCL